MIVRWNQAISALIPAILIGASGCATTMVSKGDLAAPAHSVHCARKGKVTIRAFHWQDHYLEDRHVYLSRLPDLQNFVASSLKNSKCFTAVLERPLEVERAQFVGDQHMKINIEPGRTDTAVVKAHRFLEGSSKITDSDYFLDVYKRQNDSR
jgi:hypothetical protein